MNQNFEIRILFKNEGYGLTRDAQILSSVIGEAGFSIECVDTIKKSIPDKMANINIFLEAIEPEWLPLARKNIFIPNPEWLRPTTKAYISDIDYVFCKTRHTEIIFRNFGCKTRYISFTSETKKKAELKLNFQHFLHLGGKSLHKGTLLLVSCWRKHPNWPFLNVYWHQTDQLIDRFPNVQLSNKYLSSDEITFLQNTCGVHIYPSEVEGFGHVISEGMSVGAVIVTTDAPPMNEIIQPERGFLVKTNGSTDIMAGVKYFIDTESLSETISTISAMSESDLIDLGRAGSSWFWKNDKMFRIRLLNAIKDIYVGNKCL